MFYFLRKRTYFKGKELYYKNINKLQSEIIEIVKNQINCLDNTKFIYWEIYIDFKKWFWFSRVEINEPNLTEKEKINNPKYIKQLAMSEENKELTQKSYDLGSLATLQPFFNIFSKKIY
jgi:hypothetical protein